MATPEERKEFLRGLFFSPHHHVFEGALARLCAEASEGWGERRDEIMGGEEWDPDALFEGWWLIYHRYASALAPIRAQREERRTRIDAARINAALAMSAEEFTRALRGLAETRPDLAAKVSAFAEASAGYRGFGATQPTGGS